MSIEAVAWALSAPVASPTERAVLVGLANHASKDGTDAFPSVATLAAYAVTTPRTVQRVLRDLEASGLIRPGDPELRDALVSRSDRRPNVYDLFMQRGDTVSSREANGVTSEPLRGDISDTNGVTPVSPEPSLEPSTIEPSLIATTSLDDLKQVLVEVFGEPPPQGWGLYNRIATWIRDRGGTPADVRLRASMLATEWGRKSATPAALEKHWTRYDAEVGQISEEDVAKYQSELRNYKRLKDAEALDARKELGG